MGYIDDIKSINPLTLDDIIQVSRNNVPAKYREKPWSCSGLNHGTAVLSTEEQLCCYIASYGEMHKGKIEKSLETFPWKELTSNIEIIDWGCGQGIASVHFASKLRDFNHISKLQKITLIEPSVKALERAKANVTQTVDNNVEIETKNLYLPSVNSQSAHIIDKLHIEEPICVHLFSNILDIPEIDLKKLANIIASTGYKHYFVCMGPLNYGNHRIEAFSRYFAKAKEDVFSDTVYPQFRQLSNGKWYSCVTKGFRMLRQDGKPFLVPLSFFPPKEFLASYKLDAFWKSDETISYDSRGAFEVLAPFDIGASVYSDVDPIIAVLNNVITRGIPTKCSPFIENCFVDIFKATAVTERYGAINYEVVNQQILLDNEELFRLAPIGIARIQKVVLEAILTGRLSLDVSEWNVVVKEADYPCAALAFADLEQMYNHLCALTVEYSDRTFPKINLTIVNPIYKDSPLHLKNKCDTSIKKINKEEEYDLVIDISFKDKADAEHVQFSEFKVKNDCYFNIRSCEQTSSRQIYTSDRITYKPLTQLNQSGGYDNITDTVERLNYFLTLIFRKIAFRPGQLPILNRAMQNKGVIGLLPTGGGKSLTYQLAAMLQPGVTVVIDPLKFLMEDQYDGLRSIGIDACTYINSELQPEERAAHESMMESSEVVFAFMSPERLCIYEFRERLQNMHELGVYFSYGVIDEVHCVSEWGQDFRFSYLHLGRNLYSYVKAKNGEISLFGLTATASFDVLSDVERELSGHGSFTLDPDTIVRYENSNRLELQYKIERIDLEYAPAKFDDHGVLLRHNYPMPVKLNNSKDSAWVKSNYLKTLIPRIPEYLRELQTEDSIQRIVERFKEREELELIDSNSLQVNIDDDFLSDRETYESGGIVFCPHVNSTGLSVNVNSQSLGELCNVGSFSGSPQHGETDNKSMENMRLFRENKLPLMVATKAFGMGIDKPNVRFTINMNYSSSLESFVQEAGRAGRDRKMALSLILMTNYRLVRISRRCPITAEPIPLIKGQWFKEDDLKTILNGFGVRVDEQFIDVCNPLVDMVRLICPTAKSMSQQEGNPIQMMWNWPCDDRCSKYENCQLRHVHPDYRFQWMYYKDLKSYLNYNRIRFGSENIEYQSYDYGTVMFFFNNNFKGELEEKKKMHELLSIKPVTYFLGNDSQYKDAALHSGNGFMEALLSCKEGDDLVVWIPYNDDSYQDVAKAIYRMCIIGLIDDFTQDYHKGAFRIVTRRKKPGSYYLRMKDFLMRYYSEERAENEVEKASIRKGQNEIHKCLGYLTEFVYDKVVMKRKRAIDDIRNFCLTGIDETKDWKEINEDLKDEIFFYFNSKFARAGYRTENDEAFSLYDDIVEDKHRDFDILFKYMRVIDNDVIGASGLPKDNIKHLRGAVRLIRRSETDTNPILCFLNVFCLMIMRQPTDKNMLHELEESFIEGYNIFKSEIRDREAFYSLIERFYKEFTVNGRNAATQKEIRHLKELQLLTELEDTEGWLNDFRNNYTT